MINCKLLKEMRLTKNLRVKDLAIRAEVSESYIYAIESGLRGSNIEMLSRIADILDISLEQLILSS